MKHIIPLILSFIFIAANAFGQQSTLASERPNIIFIFIDDMGYADLSAFGNCELATPNIDRLAHEGIKFTNFYVASPICSPSRVAITTGQYPFRHGIYSYLASSEQNTKRGMDNFLNPEASSLARSMKNAGYATAHFGKWHMGGGRDVGDAPLPQAYGFDASLVSFEGLGDRLLIKGQGLSEANAKLGRGNIRWVEKWERTGIYVDSTLSFIEQHKDSPFYIHLWPGDVHDPFVPKPEWREKFRTYDNNPYKRDFLATLWNLDQQVGRVLEKLDALGLSEKTLVVFTSDNGPTDWPMYYKQYYQPPGSAHPFRGRKWSLYEGGIRMPFLARWPGQIPAGAVDSTTVLHATDLFPTFCKLAGIILPDIKFDGQDMSMALQGKPEVRNQPIYWEYGREDFYLKPGNPRYVSPNMAMRDGEWKLLVNADNTGAELYNLEEDLAETTNLAEEYPDIVKRMSEQIFKAITFSSGK